MKVEVVVDEVELNVLLRMKHENGKYVDMVLSTDKVNELVSRLMEANGYIVSKE